MPTRDTRFTVEYSFRGIRDVSRESSRPASFLFRATRARARGDKTAGTRFVLGTLL